MFESVQESKKSPKVSPKDRLTAIWGSPVVRYGLVAFGVTSLGAVGYGYSLWGRAISSDCDVGPPPKLSIDELVDMKERLAVYQHDRSKEAYLPLSVDELGFLVATKTDIIGDYKLTPQGLDAKMTVPRGDGTCYKVDFLGLVDVHRGDILLRPIRLIVGSLDLTSWFQPEYHVESSYLGGAAEETFDNITEIRFTTSEVQIKLHNRKKIW